MDKRTKYYLSYFSYEDWKVGSDSKLRLGDKIYCNHQRGYDGKETDFEGVIVLHDHNKIPIVLWDFEEGKEDEGQYASLSDMDEYGWTFTRLEFKK